MTVRTLARIVGNHIQNVAMLSGLDVPWPDSFRNLFSWTQLFNIDLSRILISLRLPTFTQRLVFIVVSIGIPLSLMLLTALVFFSIASIVQIALFICSVALLVLHTISFADPTILPAAYNESVGSLVSLWFAWAGVMTLLAYRIVRIRQYDVASALLWSGTVLWGVTITGIDLLPKRVILAIFTLVILTFWLLRLDRQKKAIGIIGTIAVAGVIIWLVEKWEVKLPAQIRILGWILFGLGAMAAVTRVVSLVSSGGNGVLGFFSKIRAKLARLLDTGLLTAILFLMSMVYSPVITNAMQLFVCEEYSCPPGYAFNPYAARPEDDPYTTSQAVFCEMCNFTSSCGFSTYDLCPGFKSRRLLYDPATTCDNKSYTSFIIASCLVLFVFVVILQVMYVKVVDSCTKVMAIKTKAGHQRLVAQFQEDLTTTDISKEVEAPPSFGEKWEDVCLRVSPKASSLYDAFRFGLRYFILVESLYKTVEVLSTTFLSPLSPAAAVLALLAHTAFLFVLILLRPFADVTEQWLSVLLSLCMVLSTLYSILVWQSPAVFSQSGWAIAILIVNVVIPLVGGIFLMYTAVKNQFCRRTITQHKQEVEEREIQKKLQQEKELEKKLTKKEIMLKRHLDRERKLREEMDKYEAAYASGSAENAEDELDGVKKREKTTKDLKREQMTPSQKLAEFLNNFTKKIILLYFAFMAIPLLCVALVLTLLSGDISGNTEFVDASNFFDRSRQTVLNSYFSWDEFSSSCCCFGTEKFLNHGTNNVTERWICMNFANASSRANATAGASFFRTRIDGGGSSGMAIRPMCGLQLASECAPEILSDDTVQMHCESAYVKQNNISDYALSILW